MRVLMTGASSFTGAWIAAALACPRASVTAPLRRPIEAGDGVRQARIAKARASARLVGDAPFGSDRFLDCIQSHGPFDLLVLHGADVGRFREDRYDAMAAFERNTCNLDKVLDLAFAMGCRRLVVTGSVFEADEGIGDLPLNAIGPYGLAKTLTWHAIRHAAVSRQMALGKVVIAAPFGPLQQQGLVGALLTGWCRRERPELRQPRLVRDFLHVELLAELYAGFALALPMRAGLYRLAPSGYVESVAAFAERVAQALRPRLGLPCAFGVTLQPEPSEEPMVRHNRDRSELERWRQREPACWDALAASVALQGRRGAIN